MFCPKCSHLQTSDNLRFCSRCGFTLDEVKALIEREEALAIDEHSRAASLLPRQKDISIGAGLMFSGGIVAVLWAFMISAGPLDVALPQAFFILGFTLAFVLLFFHPLVGALHKIFSANDDKPRNLAEQQNGINLGAILMFIGTLKAMLLTTLMNPSHRGTTTLLFMAGGFLLLLMLRWLVEVVYQLLFRGSASGKDKAATTETEDLTARLPLPQERTFPAAQGIPVNDVASSKVKHAGVVQPPSVTEYTTELLDKG